MVLRCTLAIVQHYMSWSKIRFRLCTTTTHELIMTHTTVLCMLLVPSQLATHSTAHQLRPNCVKQQACWKYIVWSLEFLEDGVQLRGCMCY